MIRSVLYLLYGLVILMIVRMVMRGIGRLFGGQDASRPAGGGRGASTRVAEDLVRDPVCHTYVPRSRALPEMVEGRREYFCSEACRDRARAAVPSAS